MNPRDRSSYEGICSPEQDIAIPFQTGHLLFLRGKFLFRFEGSLLQISKKDVYTGMFSEVWDFSTVKSHIVEL